MAASAGVLVLWALAVVGTAGATAPTCGTGGAFSVSGSKATCTYTTPGSDTFNAPAGVISVDVVAVGAAGGASTSGGPGGEGASVEDEAVPVSAGSGLNVVVGGVGGQGTIELGGAGGINGGGAGGNPTGGFNYVDFGGGGGGWSGVIASGSALVVAGGGGGAGADATFPYGAGGAGDSGSGDGGPGGNGYTTNGNLVAIGGGGGTQTAGGSDGTGTGGGGNGQPGSGFDGGQGGSSSLEFTGGGGGGGAFAGGGGGAGYLDVNSGAYSGGGGGGGGASFGATGLSNGTDTTAPASVTIGWSVASTSTSVSAPASGTTNTAIAATSISSTLSGGASPTGTITFEVFGPQPSPPSDCTTGYTTVGTASVSGDGTYNPSAGFTPTAAGTYWWYAGYGGDSSNGSSNSCGSGLTSTTVVNSTTTSVSAPATGTTNTAIPAASIASTLSGGTGPTGTITFEVFGPLPSAPSDCTTGFKTVGTASVSGNGTYHPSAGFTPTAAGTYWWYAGYGGDSSNGSSNSECGSGMISTTVAPAVAVTGLSPNAGPATGANTVTINGANFTRTSTVKFGSTAATSVTFVSSTRLKAVAPAHAAGVVHVTVTTAAGKSAAANANLYSYGPPAVSSLSPTSGITGRTVTISGSGFVPQAKVKFGTHLSPAVTFISPSSLKATVPNGAVSGTVSVTDPAGTGTSSQSFTVTLSITHFSPTSGPAGTVVTITGAGFNSRSAVKFNGLVAESVTHVSATTLKATVPSGATSGPITATNTTSPVGTVSSAISFSVT